MIFSIFCPSYITFVIIIFFFFFNDTATTEIYTLSLHDALPILAPAPHADLQHVRKPARGCPEPRSEEHTSELQSQFHLVCRLLLEKKKQQIFVRASSRDPGRAVIVVYNWGNMANVAVDLFFF